MLRKENRKSSVYLNFFERKVLVVGKSVASILYFPFFRLNPSG